MRYFFYLIVIFLIHKCTLFGRYAATISTNDIFIFYMSTINKYKMLINKNTKKVFFLIHLKLSAMEWDLLLRMGRAYTVAIPTMAI